MSELSSVGIIVALLVLYLVVKRELKRRGKIHFRADVGQLGWRGSVRGEIEVRVSGEITYDGPTLLHVQKIFLTDTEAIDMFVDITPRESAATFNLNVLFLDKQPRKVTASLMLKARRVNNPGEVLRRKLIFQDRNHRVFKVGPFEFPYTPDLRRVATDGKVRPVDAEDAW